MKECNTDWSIVHKVDLNQAILEHEKLVGWVVRRQWSGGLSYADILQVGRIGLWHALQRFDPERGTAFSTYAVPAIARAVWRAVALAQRTPPEELTPHPPQEAPDLEEHLERVISYEMLHRLLAALPRRRWREVIVTHYGLDGRPPQTLTEMARAWGVSPQRIFQWPKARYTLRTEALLWLGHPARSLALRQLLDRNTVADYRAYLARQRRWQRMKRGRR
jgi:RNA polymerase sigma factor (sigma-70 family)